MRERAPGSRPLTLLGWAPVVLQVTRYRAAASLAHPERSTAYAEVSLSAVDRASPWALLPLVLLVDEPLARDLGEPYGFAKEVAPLRLSAGAWTLTLRAGEGRTLSAARGLGALLLLGVRLALRRARLRVRLPRAGRQTVFAFQSVGRVAPVLGLASPALRAWACGAWLLPLGVVVQDFAFVLEEPRGQG